MRVNRRSFRSFWQYELDLTKATGSVEAAKDDFISKLQRVVQLTGFSDPVYAEAYVNVQGFDIFLDVLIVNQTNETLQNLTCEFATLGDLKLVERPTTHTLGPQSFQSIKATIKVSTTAYQREMPILTAVFSRYVGLVNGNRCHLWKHLLRWSIGLERQSMRCAERHSHRYPRLHHSRLL